MTDAISFGLSMSKFGKFPRFYKSVEIKKVWKISQSDPSVDLFTPKESRGVLGTASLSNESKQLVG